MTGTKITETVTVTDAEGNVISSSEEETGSEKKEWTEEDDGNGEQTPVEVELVPGETTTGKVEPTETTGDDDKTDGEWNYTETTTTDRTVEATTSEITTSSTPGETTFDDVAPDDYEGKEYITDKTPEKSPIAPEAFEKTEGDFLFSGNRGEMSMKGYIATNYIIYERDENGNIKLDEEGNPIFTVHSRGGMFEDDSTYVLASQFLLWDKDGNPIYTYCVDSPPTTAARVMWQRIWKTANTSSMKTPPKSSAPLPTTAIGVPKKARAAYPPSWRT